MRLRRCGPDAVLIEVAGLAEVGPVRAALRRAELPNLVELVPAARSVLAAFAPGTGVPASLQAALEAVDANDLDDRETRQVVLRVDYDGPDLDLVAETAGLSTDEVVDLHTGAEYTVAFCGFAPGFGYLAGLPEPLRQPRLDDPRTKVPAGSVGVAGEFTAAYPRESPGGWRLIGTLVADSEPLFDPRRDPAALLAPGDHVRFERVK
jgi:KipI family sensor histidine kinase inhibitor